MKHCLKIAACAIALSCAFAAFPARCLAQDIELDDYVEESSPSTSLVAQYVVLAIVLALLVAAVLNIRKDSARRLAERSADRDDSQREALGREVRNAVKNTRQALSLLQAVLKDSKTRIDKIHGLASSLTSGEVPEGDRAAALRAIDSEAATLQRLLASASELPADGIGLADGSGMSSDIGRVAREIAMLFSGAAEQRGSKIEVAVKPDFPVVALPEQSLRRMLMDILAFALKVAEGGGIKLSASAGEAKGSPSATTLELVCQIAGAQKNTLLAGLANRGGGKGKNKSQIHSAADSDLAECRMLAETLGGSLACRPDSGGAVLALKFQGVRIDDRQPAR